MMLATDFSKGNHSRDINMVRMEVESVVTQALPNGQLVLPGVSEIKVYEDEVGLVLALVQDDEEKEAVKRAEREFEKKFKKYAEEKCNGDIAKAKDVCPYSIQSVFCTQNSDAPHIRPLLSAKIIEKDIPPPKKKEAWEASNDTAKMVAAAFEMIMTNKELRKAMARELKEEIFEEENSSQQTQSQSKKGK